MTTFTFDHMHLRSPDPDATAAFFEKMFGAEVIRTMQRGKPRVDVRLDGVNIFIAPSADKDGQAPAHPHRGLDHFGLRVRGLDDVVAGLKAKGVKFTVEPHLARPGLRICFLETPEGVLIEIVDRDVAA
ncbi:MAG: VOC family protein [Hyphomicrobiaceae bacterium]